ncbi:YhcH/YjgK/YiaL family protein [Paenibacillus thalictri]|uniref:YhcH/YjgK/YiaL family protein n=1 Tax=Paenibacillus thalictri TaxID=2527873 RepID=UPI0013EF0AC8|nr:YhcH/YjgK/YiaL family protein [Paenibacillus thalictri]
MIYDHVDNAELYVALHEKFAAAFQYLQEQPLDTMKPGKYEIEGDELFLLLQSYPTRPLEQGFWEAHRRYIDIQVMLEGTERMGVAQTGRMTVTEDHLEEKDYKVLTGEGDFLDVRAGCFTIFFPGDAHMPCLAAGSSQQIRKAVFKVKIK